MVMLVGWGIVTTLAGLVAFNAAELAQARERNSGGDPVNIAQHPWQVAIEIKVGGATQFCGGALIRPRVVLTAAHCLHGSKEQDYPKAEPRDVKVKSGVAKYAAEGNWEPVEDVLLHRGYNPRQDTGVKEYDIALVALARRGAGEPIALAEAALIVPAGQILEASGWGDGPYRGGGEAMELRVAKLPNLDLDTCSAPKGALCVGFAGDASNAFRGDSGGPLVWRMPKGPVLVGVNASRNRQPANYGVYMRVAFFSDWFSGKEWPKDWFNWWNSD